MNKKKYLAAEYRAEPVTIKALTERRGELLEEMDKLIAVQNDKGEQRAMTEEEQTRFSELEKEINEINATEAAERRAEAIKAEIRAKQKPETRSENNVSTDQSAPESEKPNDAEIRALVNYIRNSKDPEERADEQNITMGNNGAIIPTTIAQLIVNKAYEMCPIMSGATHFNSKGKLKIPVWGAANETHDITVGYHEEFKELVADSGKFTSVDLDGYLIGGLVLIGKSVINNADIDVLNFVINEIGRKVALFNEKELLTGSDKMQGALATTTKITSGSQTSLTADDLIDLQSKVPTAYQPGACWTMNPTTFAAIKKLKDTNGRYLLTDNTSNVTNSFPYMLLGKPVYLSDNMPEIGAGNKAVLYGDYSGLATNMRQNIELQVLNEQYATQHAVGIIVWYEMDSKVIDNQKLAVLEIKGGE